MEKDKTWIWIVCGAIGFVILLAIFLFVSLYIQSSKQVKSDIGSIPIQGVDIKSNKKEILSDYELLGIASSMEKQINVLIDWTTTNCLASGSHFLFVTDKSIFSNTSTRKGWTIAVVGVVGHFMNEHTDIKLENYNIYMADVSYLKNKKVYLIKASLCKDLQYKTKNGSISLDEMYQNVLDSLSEKIIENN